LKEPQVAAGRRALPSLASGEESGGLTLMTSLLLATFGVSVLLLTLAALPPAWSGRLALSARLYNARGAMVMAGVVLLLESGVIALVFAT
jgi:hypothetical protein